MPISIAGAHGISCRVRQSARARRLRITVSPAGVEVVAPRRAREADVLAFVEHHRSWIEGKVGALRRTLEAHPGPARLADGGHISYRGRPVELRILPTRGARTQVSRGDALEVCMPQGVVGAAREDAIERALCRWLKRAAQIEVEAIVRCCGAAHGLVPSAVRVKQQKHLWGSCTAKGVINLNWRLILAPPEVLEYVVVHELCHLRARHHQRAFWRLVGEVLPGFEGQRRWLKDNGHLLTLRPGVFN